MKNGFYLLFSLFTFLVVAGIISTAAGVAFAEDTYTVPQTAEVTLAWDPVDPAPDGYRLYHRKEGELYDYSQPCWTGSNTTGTVYNLDWDSTYYFVVRAYVGTEESADSNEVTFLSESSAPTFYTITVTTGENGAVSPANSVSVDSGSNQTFTITPNAGYHVSDVEVDGVSVGSVLSYTFNQVTANHTLEATFAIDSYTVTASAGANGTITPAGGVTVNRDSTATFEITPNDGYMIEDVIVDGSSVGAVSTYTFSQISKDHTISASFSNITHFITASTTGSGSVTPTGMIEVNHGSSVLYTITPETGSHVSDVHVDGISIGSVSSYSFNPVVGDHTIHAIFVADSVTVTSTAGTYGTISPAGSITLQIGSNQTFSMIPDDGYVISDLLVDGISMGNIETYTFSNITTDHVINAVFIADNQAPAADAGPDQTVDEGQTVRLSGLNSLDPDDGIASFQWRQIQGDQVVLNSPSEPETIFTTPNVDSSGAALVFELTVTDYNGATSTDSCIVNVTWVNLPPHADAGIDLTVYEEAQVVLDASNSTDSDNGIASYVWKQLSGPVVELSGVNTATPTFFAPDVGSAGMSLTFEVTVTDTSGLQDTDTCVVNVTWVNTPPVADAGLNQSAVIGEEIFLDGSKSYDADDLTITSYRWTQTTGEPVQLSDTTIQSPMFIVPAEADGGSSLTFELTVTDSGGLQGVDSCLVNVQSIDPALYISSITMELKQKAANIEANAYVTILDDAGTIVKEANVTGKWLYNGNIVNTATATTRGDGSARLYSNKVAATSGAVFEIEITGITKDGYTYDPSLNAACQKTTTIP